MATALEANREARAWELRLVTTRSQLLISDLADGPQHDIRCQTSCHAAGMRACGRLETPIIPALRPIISHIFPQDLHLESVWPQQTPVPPRAMS
jgi:hypothetical protein